MTPRTRGRAAGHLWASTATPVEMLRMENAGSETPAEDFAAAVSCGMNPGFGAAFAVIVSGDEDVDVDSLLTRLGMDRAAMDEVEFARGFLEGVAEGQEADQAVVGYSAG